MNETSSWWSRRPGLREQLPTDAVDAIDRTARDVLEDADYATVIEALHARGLGFISAIAGSLVLQDLSFAEARVLVEASPSFSNADDHAYAAQTVMAEATAGGPAARQGSTTAHPSEPSNDDTSHQAGPAGS